MAGSAQNAQQPIADLVRAADPDRYLAALYAPEDRRAALLELFAFNAEIAGIRDRISQALPGEIRLQWWRDTLASTEEGAVAGHPVAQALAEAIRQYRLPKSAFDNYLEARVFDLYDDPMPSRTDLEGYCGETASALIQLAAVVLDPSAAPAFAELSGHAGCAQAITGLVLLFPLHRARGQCYVPSDVLAAAGCSREAFLAGDGQAARNAAAAMIALAREHLSAFEGGAQALPQTLRPAFLPLAVTRAYLDRMEGREAQALTTTVGIPAWRKQWVMFRHAARGWG